jgi:hypothetical protein
MAADDTSVAIARLTFLESERSSENELLAQRATWLVLAQSFVAPLGLAIVWAVLLAQPAPAGGG